MSDQPLPPILAELPADAVLLSGGDVTTEWAVRWPTAKLDADSDGIEIRDDEADARRVALTYFAEDPEVVSRVVTRGPWTAVDA